MEKPKQNILKEVILTDITVLAKGKSRSNEQKYDYLTKQSC